MDNYFFKFNLSLILSILIYILILFINNIIFFTSYLNFNFLKILTIYHISIFIVCIFIILFNFKFNIDSKDQLFISIIFIIYSLIEFRYGIIILPVRYIIIFFIYSIGLFIGSLLTYIINKINIKNIYSIIN